MHRLLDISRRWWHASRAAALELALPATCRSCHVDLPDGDDLLLMCRDCRGELRLFDKEVCPRCAGPVPFAGGKPMDCRVCRNLKLRFDRAIAVGLYEGLLRELVLRMKADSRGGLAHMFVELLWAEHGGELASLSVDVVVAAPERARMLNHNANRAPAALAEVLARKLRAPLAVRLLGVGRGVSKQVGLSRAGRFENMRGQMFVRRGYHLDGAHVLLVDDILTSGATGNEAARALKKAGASRVTLVVAARTPAAS